MTSSWSDHAHIIPISRMVDFCESYSPFHVCWQRSSCVHKMWERTYGQTNMKRAITLTKINHPWNRYNMLMVRILYRFHGWLIFARVIALFMFIWPYVRPHILCTQLVVCLLLDFIHIWYRDWNKHEKGYNSRKNQPSVKSVYYAHAQIMANQDTK
jgi:hypothetical protein